MKRSLSCVLLALLLSYNFYSEALTHKEAAKKKVSYLSHFKGLSGTLDIEDGVLNIHNNLRIQANRAYVDNVPDRGLKLIAHGNIMVNYRGKTLICDYLEYYEDTDSCLLTNGRFALYPWFLGGSMMTLTPETIIIHKGYISTSEGPDKHICLSGDYLEYSSDGVLSIGKTTFSLCNIPLMFFPKFSIMPMEIPKPPINFRGGTGGFLGSYLGISYSPISKKHFSSTFFLDSFFKHGIGIGYNIHFSQKEHPENVFNIKSYYAHRLAIDMPEPRDRYRFHGDFSLEKYRAKLSGEYHVSDSWETVADIFPNNFSLKNTGPTQVCLSWRDPMFYGNIFSSVKVNSFQNVNQALPCVSLHQHPKNIKNTKVYFENFLECGYFNFAFSNNIPGENFSSLRAAISPKLYRAFPLIWGTITPTLLASAIYYSSVPKESTHHTQASAQIHVDYRFSAYKNYLQTKHIVEPFISYTLASRPVMKNDEHYIFSIHDAFSSLHLMKLGVESFLSHRMSPHAPQITAKLWTTHIFRNAFAKTTFPKTACTLSLPLGSKNTFSLDAEWIWKKHCWDHMNLFWQWVGSEHMAITLEFLHRSKYGLRKCDKENYILDVSRPIDELLDSPLSARRNFLLGKVFLRPHPCWHYHLILRYGWHHTNMPNYLEYQMTLGTKIFEHWRLYSVYEKREADKRFFFYLKLDKSKHN